MKRILPLLLTVLLLCGCNGADDEMDRAMTLRSKMLARGVSFETVITADYGDKLHSFSVSCVADEQGNLTFTVLQPEVIAGITGKITAAGGKLTFDDAALSFPLLADGQLTPVAAPWVLIRTLHSGYLTSCGGDGEYLRLAIDDSYEEDALHLDIWLGSEDLPVRGEVLWQGRRILSLEIKNFTFL